MALSTLRNSSGSPDSTPIILAAAAGALLLYLAVHYVNRAVARAQIIRENGCKPVRKYPLKDTWLGLDYWMALNRAAKSEQLLVWLREQYTRHGTTYYSRLHTTDVINTCDPDNLKAMHSDKFKDFSVDARRELAFKPLLGQHSVLLANGPLWEHKRAMLRPSFSREQYGNLPLFERHVDRLVQSVKSKGPEVDLADFFLCLTVDFTSELMFGESISLLASPNMELVDNMTRSAESGHARWLLVMLAKFTKQPVYHDSVQRVREFMGRYVDRALAYRAAKDKGGEAFEVEKTAYKRIIYLQELASATDDRQALLDELTTILFAGRDTTAALLTNLMWLFSQHPEIWAKLREEIAVLGGEKPTFEQLKGLPYLQNCLSEALRLYPVIPINTRMAHADTVLPRGGGPNGDEPIFVATGTNIAFHVTALHRRKDLWGDDADEFKPERWNGNRHAWKYQPFGMGPRNCPGQHLSLTEAGYTVLRLAQEFETMASNCDEPWTERIALTCTNKFGARVKAVPAS